MVDLDVFLGANVIIELLIILFIILAMKFIEQIAEQIVLFAFCLMAIIMFMELRADVAMMLSIIVGSYYSYRALQKLCIRVLSV